MKLHAWSLLKLDLASCGRMRSSRSMEPGLICLGGVVFTSIRPRPICWCLAIARM